MKHFDSVCFKKATRIYHRWLLLLELCELVIWCGWVDCWLWWVGSSFNGSFPSAIGEATGEHEEEEEEPDIENSEQLIEQEIEQSPISPYRSYMACTRLWKDMSDLGWDWLLWRYFACFQLLLEIRQIDRLVDDRNETRFSFNLMNPIKCVCIQFAIWPKWYIYSMYFLKTH